MTAHPDVRRATLRSRWSPGRLAAAVAFLGWVLLISPLPSSLEGAGIVLVLLLIGLDIVLGIVTGWLALQPTSRLDERQTILRDTAYRIAFRLTAAGIFLVLISTLVGTILTMQHTITLRPIGINPRDLAALIEMFVILPTATIAWLQPVDLDEAEVRGTTRSPWWLLLFLPLLAVVWASATQLMPASAVVVRGTPGAFLADDMKCDVFTARKEILARFGGAIGFHAGICWNGERAFIFGDPSLGAAARQEATEPPITSCSTADAETDFATVSQHCTAQLDADGTVRMRAEGRISPLPFGWGARDVDVELAVSRDGKLLSS